MQAARKIKIHETSVGEPENKKKKRKKQKPKNPKSKEVRPWSLMV